MGRPTYRQARRAVRAVVLRRTHWRRALRVLRWYVRELTGESAYDRYVAHLRLHHPGGEVPSRREFERMRMARREADPRARAGCC
ncbi:protein of unknown function DUF466 [Actinobacteria bacterium OK074]|nr:protein of unknown function DUF466 [Actinobacteria bacterium OK074]